jgi:hypothetical protein
MRLVFPSVSASVLIVRPEWWAAQVRELYVADPEMEVADLDRLLGQALLERRRPDHPGLPASEPPPQRPLRIEGAPGDSDQGVVAWLLIASAVVVMDLLALWITSL